MAFMQNFFPLPYLHTCTYTGYVYVYVFNIFVYMCVGYDHIHTCIYTFT